ncbi:MAG TPA: phosphatidate cytidylyltransferase [Candidatus Lokiarchaeia archaeon]
MKKPIIGIESIFFSIAISVILIMYAILFLPIVKRSFKTNSKNKYNSLLVVLLIIFLAIMLSLPLSATTRYYLYMPLNFYALVVAGALLLFFFVFAKLRKLTTEEEEFNLKLSKGIDHTKEKSILDTYNFTPKQEMKRKIVHLCTIFYLATWIFQPLIFYGVVYLYSNIENTTTFENYFNAHYLFEYKDLEIMLYNGLITQFFMFLCIFWYNADAEIMRLRFNKYDFLFKKMLQITRRPTEINDISASILLLLALATSAIILTYDSANRIAGIYAQMAVICIAVLSDMFAALIGRKWGKHKWPFVKGKSFEGSIAGFLVGFLTATFFVGWFLALIGALIFVFTDIALAKVRISDNASNPILLAITFKILIIFVDPLMVSLPFIKIW